MAKQNKHKKRKKEEDNYRFDGEQLKETVAHRLLSHP